MKIDLNCDIGEGFGIYTLCSDDEIMQYISSANIACGFHAGDPTYMKRTVHLAERSGVAIGAHPGFPDLLGFGRREMKVDPAEIRDYVIYQIGALQAFTNAKRLQHVKPHGALHNMGASNKVIARAVAEAIREVDSHLILVGLAGSAWIRIGHEVGLRVASEVFADRALDHNGMLVSRSHPRAVICDVEDVIARSLRIVVEGKVTAITGEEINIRGDTICVHSDTPGAVTLTRLLKESLEAAGVMVVSMGTFL